VAEAPKPAAKGPALTRKVGPLPVYAWAALAIGGYLVLRKFSGAAAGGGASPASQPVQPTQGTDASAGGASSGGADQSGILAGLFGGLQAATDQNSNLTNALLQDNSAIIGFGQTALGLNAQLEQSIISSYVPSGSSGGSGGGSYAPAPVQQQAPAAPSYSFSKITAVAQSKPFISFTTQNAGAFQHLANVGAASKIKLH
jgi:hypothetical protein